MQEMGQWLFLPIVPCVFGCLMFGPIYLVRPWLVNKPRFEQQHAVAGSILLLATMLATTAGLVTATLLADADRESWARIGLMACKLPTTAASELALASGASVLVAANTRASFSSTAYSGRVVSYGTGPLAGQSCDSYNVRGE